MGDEADRRKFVESVKKAARIAKKLRDLGARPYGVIRIDSASGVDDWYKDPEGNQKKIAETFREAGKITPVIEKTYPLSEVPDAIRYLHEGNARGKVVITV